MNGPILLVGAGRMGTALLKGWMGSQHFPAIHVVELAPSQAVRNLATNRSIILANEFERKWIGVCAVVLALKPQVLRREATLLKAIGATNALVVSIAAGIPTAFLRSALGSVRVVRAMPNTPGAIGRGVTALYAPEARCQEDRALAECLMAPLGNTFWLDDEALMDVVTAVSGSGPAYVFLLAETMAKAGISQGLPPSVAGYLARTTIIGAGALLEADFRQPEDLRRDVTSPEGTTEAALNVLMGANGLEDLMLRAIAVAAQRGKEMGASMTGTTGLLLHG